MSTIEDGSIRCLTMDETYVVFQPLGIFMILISGLDDIDELILADVMQCLQQAVSENFGGFRNENCILDVENYANFSVLVDEIVSQVRYLLPKSN